MMSLVRAHYTLALLTLSYLLGEMGHFLLGATSRTMAQELEFGEEGCLCGDQVEEEECLAAGCDWDYTGRGMEYQLLAGDGLHHLRARPPLHPRPFHLHCFRGLETSRG